MVIIVYFCIVTFISQVLSKGIPREALIMWLLAQLVSVDEWHHQREGVVFTEHLFLNPSIALVRSSEVLSP